MDAQSTSVSPSLNAATGRAGAGLVAVNANHQLGGNNARGKHAVWKLVALLERGAVAIDVFLDRKNGHAQRPGKGGQGDEPAANLGRILGREAGGHPSRKTCLAYELKFLRVHAPAGVTNQLDLPADIFQQSLTADIVSINGRVVKNRNYVVGGVA